MSFSGIPKHFQDFMVISDKEGYILRSYVQSITDDNPKDINRVFSYISFFELNLAPEITRASFLHFLDDLRSKDNRFKRNLRVLGVFPSCAKTIDNPDYKPELGETNE